MAVMPGGYATFPVADAAQARKLNRTGEFPGCQDITTSGYDNTKACDMSQKHSPCSRGRTDQLHVHQSHLMPLEIPAKH